MKHYYPLFKPKHVGICGGTKLKQENALFCQYLGTELAQEENLIIMTGGFKNIKSKDQIPSADYSTILGVNKIITDKNLLESRVETLIPDPKYENPEIERFYSGKKIVLENKSLQARRFMLVNKADVLIAVEGAKGTREMIDLAFAIEKPCLPIPFTGGFARDKWFQNKQIICEWFDITPQQAEDLESIKLTNCNENELRKEAQKIKYMILEKLKRKCFIIMPFRKEYDNFFNHIKDILHKEGFEPIRTDKMALVGNIVDMIRQGLYSSDCIIAEITERTPNVMYEIGLAHAFGKPVIMFIKGNIITNLPFDIVNERVFLYNELEDIDTNLSDLLQKVKQISVPIQTG
jgi:nucleoside 2-deoxyribosyltransferase